MGKSTCPKPQEEIFFFLIKGGNIFITKRTQWKPTGIQGVYKRVCPKGTKEKNLKKKFLKYLMHYLWLLSKIEVIQNSITLQAVP